MQRANDVIEEKISENGDRGNINRDEDTWLQSRLPMRYPVCQSGWETRADNYAVGVVILEKVQTQGGVIVFIGNGDINQQSK